MLDKVRESVISDLREMNYATSELTGDTKLGADGLALDSLAIAELATRMEDAYGVRFAEDDFENLAQATLDEFVQAVVARIDPALVASEADRR